MLGMHVAANSPHQPPPRVEHVRGLEALPLITRALTRFEPAVLMTSDGLGAIHASVGPEASDGRKLWFLADARALLDKQLSQNLNDPALNLMAAQTYGALGDAG